MFKASCFVGSFTFGRMKKTGWSQGAGPIPGWVCGQVTVTSQRPQHRKCFGAVEVADLTF